MSNDSPKDAFVVDIETETPTFDSLSPEEQEYFTERSQKDQKYSNTMDQSLTAAYGLSKILCIGTYRTDRNSGVLLQEGEASTPKSSAEDYVIIRGDEKHMLEQFWGRAKAAADDKLRLVTFFGEAFDMPTIMIRSAMLGVTPSVYAQSSRYGKKSTYHLDLNTVLSFRGSGKNYSLAYWCRRFDIKSPKDDMKGSMVAEAYRAGRIDDIGRYCMRDVKATVELYAKLEDTIIPTFFEY